jgi:23S rRNA pseudouridine1911/1915/1917 synthase
MAWAEARDALDSRALSGLLAAAITGAEGQSLVASSFRPYGPRGARVACVAPESGAPKAIRPGASIYRSRILEASLRPAEGEGPGIIELRIGLERGFRHQIRAQLAWIGLPIVGDALYSLVADSRLRLYAVRLSLIHPVSGNAFAVELD